MKTAQYVALGLFGVAAVKAYSAYQDVNQFGGHPFRAPGTSPQPGDRLVTPENCMTVRQGENIAFRETVIASGLALGGLYLWMR